MLGIAGMQGILASSGSQSEGGWPVALLQAVDTYRNGPPDDDTLVIEIYRPLRTAEARTRSREVLVSESVSP